MANISLLTKKELMNCHVLVFILLVYMPLCNFNEVILVRYKLCLPENDLYCVRYLNGMDEQNTTLS